MAVTLIGGGARSGKSRFALQYVEERYCSGVFLATAEARDDEMRERIAHHRAERGEFWTTVEAPLDLVEALKSVAAEVVVVDCLTLWLSNVLLDPSLDAAAEIDRLTEFIIGQQGPEIVLVTNEVGCGIVPENALAREFRDLAGRLNQRAGAAADRIYWMIFGVPLTVKGR